MSAKKRDYLPRLQTLLVNFILNDITKTKLAILSFLCRAEIVKKNSTKVISVRPPGCREFKLSYGVIPAEF